MKGMCFFDPHPHGIQAINSSHLHRHSAMKRFVKHKPMATISPVFPEMKRQVGSELRGRQHSGLTVSDQRRR
jgi:hypothetical protein